MAKKFKQMTNIPASENKQAEIEKDKELIEQKLVYELGIHALPGTEFTINNGAFVMNNLGNFSMSCEEHPIQSLKVTSDVNDNYPIIIDIIYEEVINNG